MPLFLLFQYGYFFFIEKQHPSNVNPLSHSLIFSETEHFEVYRYKKILQHKQEVEKKLLFYSIVSFSVFVCFSFNTKR